MVIIYDPCISAKKPVYVAKIQWNICPLNAHAKKEISHILEHLPFCAWTKL